MAKTRMESTEYQYMDHAEAALWWYRALHVRVLGLLAPVSGRVLDAGCGTGGLLVRIRATRPDLVAFGLEWDAAAATRAAQKSGTPIARGSINTLPFGPATFDAVVAADVLCHAAVDPASALAEIIRVLRPGGRLIVNMPAFAWLASAHDRRVHNVRRQSASDVAAMLVGNGLANIRVRYWNSLLFPLMVVQRKLLARHADAASDVAALPGWLDAAFHAVTAIERRLPMSFPAGGSVLATARRRPESRR
jgi:SAM-dependent methyltransferase